MHDKPAFRGTCITEDITEFRDVPLADLPTVAEDLCHVPPPRTDWGRWWAVAHDFVYEMLEHGTLSCSTR